MKCTQEQIKFFNEHGYYLLDETSLREYNKDSITEFLTKYNRVTTDFFREFKDKLNWRTISQRVILEEKEIEEFKDYVDWSYIKGCFHLSEEFKNKHKDRFKRIK